MLLAALTTAAATALATRNSCDHTAHNEGLAACVAAAAAMLLYTNSQGTLPPASLTGCVSQAGNVGVF